jgi:pimeloyl-ACP methyl ester carboxylesterase
MNTSRSVPLSTSVAICVLFSVCSTDVVLAQTLELEERTALVDDKRIAYRVGGEGPPLLLIHGFTVTGHQWDAFLDEFAAHFRVIVPDLPGHGRSDEVAGTFRYLEAARSMWGLLDALGIERASGIGHSAGASILIHMAVQEPTRLERMVLVAGGHRLSVAGRESLGRLELADMPDTLLAYYRAHHAGGEAQARDLFVRLRGMADNYDDFEFSPERLATLSTETLLVWGDRDVAYPIDMAVELYQSIPNASLWIVPGQDHYPIWPWLGGSPEAESIFVPLVRRFLEGR